MSNPLKQAEVTASLQRWQYTEWTQTASANPTMANAYLPTSAIQQIN